MHLYQNNILQIGVHDSVKTIQPTWNFVYIQTIYILINWKKKTKVLNKQVGIKDSGLPCVKNDGSPACT